jgi:hypothetical protein
MEPQDPVEEGPGWVIREKEARHYITGSYSHLVVGGDSIPLICHSAFRQYRAGLVGIPALSPRWLGEVYSPKRLRIGYWRQQAGSKRWRGDMALCNE